MLCCKQKAAYEVRVSDCSSGVCSSDLLHVLFYIHTDGGVSRLEATKGGAQESRIVGGSQILALKMAEELGDTVRLSTPVKSVRNWKGSDVVEIETAKSVDKARQVDRKSTRLNPVTNAQLVCRRLLDKIKQPNLIQEPTLQREHPD